MKRTMLLAALLAASALASLGQEPKGGQILVEAQSAGRAEARQKPVTVTPDRPASQLLGRRVYYGGYLTDFFRAERKRPLFSLRTPVDPRQDSANLIYDATDTQIRGVALFSIKF